MTIYMFTRTTTHQTIHNIHYTPFKQRYSTTLHAPFLHNIFHTSATNIYPNTPTKTPSVHTPEQCTTKQITPPDTHPNNHHTHYPLLTTIHPPKLYIITPKTNNQSTKKYGTQQRAPQTKANYYNFTLMLCNLFNFLNRAQRIIRNPRCQFGHTFNSFL